MSSDNVRVSAQDCADGACETKSIDTQSGGSLETGSGGRPETNSGTSKKTILNPLKAPSIEAFLLNIIDIVLVFLIPVIVLYIIYAGFKFVTARGDTGQIAEARRALLWAVVGGVIVLGARLIINVIQETINELVR
jgi:hypothetical protein